MQRQYSGTAGRIENFQVGVFLSYASSCGRALLDRELYLPREWADDMPRRQAAKVPQTVEFATKPQLARRMIERAVAAKVPFAWITGDEIYGDDRRLRVWLGQEDLHFVLAMASNQYVWSDMGGQTTVSELTEATQPLAWRTLSAGNGAKGPRLYALSFSSIFVGVSTTGERRGTYNQSPLLWRHEPSRASPRSTTARGNSVVLRVPLSRYAPTSSEVATSSPVSLLYM